MQYAMLPSAAGKQRRGGKQGRCPSIRYEGWDRGSVRRGCGSLSLSLPSAVCRHVVHGAVDLGRAEPLWVSSGRGSCKGESREACGRRRPLCPGIPPCRGCPARPAAPMPLPCLSRAPGRSGARRPAPPRRAGRPPSQRTHREGRGCRAKVGESGQRAARACVAKEQSVAPLDAGLALGRRAAATLLPHHQGRAGGPPSKLLQAS